MFVRITAAAIVIYAGSLQAQSRTTDRDASPSRQYSVWYTPAELLPAPRFQRPAPKDAADVDVYLSELRRVYETDFVRRVQKPFVARIEAAGVHVLYASSFAPAMVIRGSATAIDRVRSLPGVRRVWNSVTYSEETDSSRLTVRADAISRLPYPVTGKGVKQCVLERDSAQSANPYLPKIIYLNQPPNPPYSNHPTAVAGIIASSHAKYLGQAPGVTLLNANAGSFNTSSILAATDWAIRQGANNINASFGANTAGGLQLLDHYFDHVVRHLLLNFIKGAGNTGGYVVSPGLGFNSVTVGNSDDKKTAAWADDGMHRNSGYLDPTTGHPKPEIVAPGTNLTGLLPGSPWVGFIGSGGSYAGPQGNAAAALLLERNPLLKLWPEAVKAVLMAGAWHKIQTMPIGDRDGVGQLNAHASDAIVRAGGNRLRFGNLTPSSFDTSGNFDVRLPLDPRSETRVVVSWSSDPASNGPYTPNTLKMDLDLEVLDPSDKVVASSADTKRGFEFAQFVPQSSGIYTFRLKRKRFQGTVEPFGLAVSQIYDTSVTWISGPQRLPLGATNAFSLNDPYHPGHNYVAAASLSGGDYRGGTPLGSRMVPLVVDIATWLSLTPGGSGIFGGYAGNLDAGGQAALSVKLPVIQTLLGLELTQVGITLGTGGVVLQVSPPFKGRIVP